jgi:methionyl-tRNA synthetase
MSLARLGNKYFNDTKPWHTRKNDLQACGNTIHVSLQICASLAVLMDPVLPHSAAVLRSMLNLASVRSSASSGEAGSLGWDDAWQPLLEAGHSLGEAKILFNKIEDDVILGQIQKLKATEALQEPEVVEDAAAFALLKEEIVYDDFARLDLRMGTVRVAEKVPKADKLLRLEIDLGFEQRQILSGIAEQMPPEDLVGKRVVVVANLKPRTLRGLESQGMVLMAEDRDGRLCLIQSDGEDGAPVL